ncbi:ABC transporter ATP-binding protein [Amycolatopsis rhabdoformis]|uniref:ABC transporter ATP-binding protein n=1 Tax=Amycolatopsis rhabdoformis TaxID=1448059 RepID=A0ABZ1IEI3_9PSEU|nr:ABC transporter ATP-binding protein [Amycolatopsis rhabdoformis]WSE32088.1 ABC transporter ATP-binding protein [Amycolatopsis rhabdoformis]
MTATTDELRDPATGLVTPKLSLRGVGLGYRTPKGRFTALENVSLDLAAGEFVALVGPSGCGKSTLLKLVAGLLPATSGEILLDGEPAPEGVPEGVGLVFQSDALFPWRTVADNIRFPLALKGVPAAQQRAEVQRLVELVGLKSFEQSYPNQLSGGMRKRVGIARAIAYDPDVYLMDEPFGPLDAQMRIRLGGEFLSIWETLGKSVVFVTHDVEEAVAMADRVLVMSRGPGTIKEEFRIDLDRPRHFQEVRFEPEFQRLQRAIWRSLAEEFDEERA